jgi:hypothetical protein
MSSSTSTDVTVLQGVCEALTRQGWAARLVHHRLRGDVDVRLHVCSAQPWVEAEVLGPYDETPVGDRWNAVRVEEDERVVWSGPPRSNTSGELLQFVLDLLRAPGAELSSRYRRLG